MQVKSKIDHDEIMMKEVKITLNFNDVESFKKVFGCKFIFNVSEKKLAYGTECASHRIAAG